MNRTPRAVSLLGRCGVAALLLMTAGAWAETTCARPPDVTALKTADMQQFLMVAALTCRKVAAYNEFVLSHQGELQESDKALLSFFIAKNAWSGDDEYNAYKTSLANAASLRSLHDPLFCQNAEAAFAAALGRPVAQLISEQPVPIKLVYASCEPEGVQTAETAPPVQRQASLNGR